MLKIFIITLCLFIFPMQDGNTAEDDGLSSLEVVEAPQQTRSDTKQNGLYEPQNKAQALMKSGETPYNKQTGIDGGDDQGQIKQLQVTSENTIEGSITAKGKSEVSIGSTHLGKKDETSNDSGFNDVSSNAIPSVPNGLIPLRDNVGEAEGETTNGIDDPLRQNNSSNVSTEPPEWDVAPEWLIQANIFMRDIVAPYSPEASIGFGGSYGSVLNYQAGTTLNFDSGNAYEGGDGISQHLNVNTSLQIDSGLLKKVIPLPSLPVTASFGRGGWLSNRPDTGWILFGQEVRANKYGFEVTFDFLGDPSAFGISKDINESNIPGAVSLDKKFWGM